MDKSMSQLEWVTVRTTLPSVPYTPSSERAPIRTPRLILRPPTAQDAMDLFHGLRSQPEVMVWTSASKVDESAEDTLKWLEKVLPPKDEDTHNFAICLAETGEILGTGGSHMRHGELGWPVIGYMLRREAWGKGYATEFLEAYLRAWWALPRTEIEVKVDKSTLEEGEDGVIKEAIVAVTVPHNGASHNVLAKNAFKLVKIWEEEDELCPGKMETLHGFMCTKP